MNYRVQVCLFFLGTISPSLAGSSSSSIRSTLSSSLSSSTNPGAGSKAASAAAAAAAAAAAGAPFLSLRGGSFADAGAGTQPAPPTGFNTALIGVYTGQPQLASSSPTPPIPLPPAYTAGDYPTPWSDYPSVYPAFNGYQQLDSPGVSNYAYSIPLPTPNGLPVGSPGTRSLDLPSFGTTDPSAPLGTGYSTGAKPGVSSYLVQSINGYSSSSGLNGYPAGTRVQTFNGYVNAPPDGSLPRYIYGQV